MYKQPETLDEIRNRIDILSALANHPGWKLYKEFMHAQTELALQAALSASDAHLQSSALGGLKALRGVQDWAEGERDFLLATLKQWQTDNG
jgi:hypothetical protein